MPENEPIKSIDVEGLLEFIAGNIFFEFAHDSPFVVPAAELLEYIHA